MPDVRRRVLHLRSSGGMLGAEQVVLGLCRKSSGFGYGAVLAVTHDEGEDVPELHRVALDCGIESHLIQCRSSFDFDAPRKVRALLQEKSVDILHCHGYREDLYGVLSRTGAVKVATNHLWKRTTWKLRAYAALDSRLLRRFDHVVAVSAEIQQELEGIGLDRNRVSYIPNGVDVDRFVADLPAGEDAASARQSLGIGDEDVVLATISSLTVEKGHRLLLEAVARLIGGWPDLKVLIVGDGPEKERIVKSIRQLGLVSHVILAGRRNDIPEILRISDIFVLPSLVEGFPIALLEAMASGTPCVAMDVGNVASAIDSANTGILVRDHDPEELAQALGLLIGDPEMRSNIGSKAASLVRERFSDTKMAETYCALYDRLLGNATGRQ